MKKYTSFSAYVKNQENQRNDMMETGTKYSPVTDDVLDFNGNKIEHIEILGEDEDIKGNFKVLVYPVTGFCSVDSFSVKDIGDKFKLKKIYNRSKWNSNS